MASIDRNQSTQPSPVKYEQAVQRLLAGICYWLLQKLAGLQDVLLSFSIFRKAAAYSLAPRCRHSVLQAVQTPASLNSSFEELEYYISEDAQELLMHAALHGLIAAPMMQQKASMKMPNLGRILLQTPTKNSALYQESVAAALAKRLNAHFLVLDDALLTSVAKAAFGSSIDMPEQQEDLGKLLSFILSIWFSGGKLCFVWDVIQRTCQSIAQPLVVFVKSAEHTICGSYGREAAFQEAFGLRASSLDTLHAPSQNALVMIAGCSLGDTGADITPQTLLAAKHLDESGGTARPPPAGSTPAGHDDGLGPILPDLGSLLHADKPNARRILSKLFTTRVKLAAPPEGAAAARHNAQIAQDADKLLAKSNHIAVTGVAARMGLQVPPAGSAVYAKRQLSVADWTKVLAWAQSMQFISQTANQLKQDKQTHPSEPDSKEGHAPATSHQQPAAASQSRSIRRSKSATGSGSTPLESLPLLHASADGSSRHLDNTPDDQQQTPSAVSTQQKERLAVKIPSPGVARQAEPAAALVLQLSEGAMWYGMHMLERAGGSMRQHITTENMYEQRLLPEVVNSDEAGGGFAEVGALGEAKDALREAVQLPLQHPRLFQKGSLARPCRGVLLFGPPGTGKTLLARAAAAECGASFLAIHPSTVASKWLGDGVRYMRAVFSLASKLSPCVLFVDEVDAMLAKRDSQREHEAHREIKNEFMAQWDGIRTGSSSSIDRVMVLGATNRPQDLDEAVLRRFSRRIFCDLPNKKARREILDVILSGENIADNVSTSKVADSTEGFSGSDLRQLCTAAAMCGIRELMKATSKASKATAAAKQANSQKSAALTGVAAAPAAVASKQAAGAACEPQTSSSSDTSATAESQQQTLPSAAGTAVTEPQASTSNPISNDTGTTAEQALPNGSATAVAGHVSATAAASEQTAATGLPTQVNRQSASHDGISTAGQHGKGSKRDNEEATVSSSTKRRKSIVDQDAASTGPSASEKAELPANAEPSDDPAVQSSEAASNSSLHTERPDLQPHASDVSTHPGSDALVSCEEHKQELQLATSSSSTTAADSQTGWLMAKFYDVAATADQKANQELRAITAADFEKARQQVTPSTNPDSMVISELKQWNSTYGEGGDKGYRQHLSYYT